MAKTDCKPLPPLSEKDIARFWSYVNVKGPDECWPWTGCIEAKGYGRIRIARRSILAHRIAIFLATGVDPGRKLACHACDNRPCCNGKHLFPGTHGDNNGDMAAKGRAASGERHGSRVHPDRVPRGERSGQSKLTAEQVREMRKAYAAGGIGCYRLANRFGVDPKTVERIIKRKYWSHVS